MHPRNCRVGITCNEESGTRWNKKHIGWRPPHEDERGGEGAYVHRFYFGKWEKNCIFCFAGFMYRTDGGCEALALLCCGINARNQVEKTRLSSEKGHKNVSERTHMKSSWEAAAKKKASKWKFSHFSVLASRPRRRASAIFWTLRRTQQHSERYAFFFCYCSDVAQANVHT